MSSILLLLLACASTAMACPNSAKLHPCTCESADYSMHITCNGLYDDQTLAAAVRALEGLDDVYSLTVVDSYFNYIRHDTFQGVRLVELEFRSSSLLSFSDTDVAFAGLEDSLEILLVTDCSFMNEWNWSLLKNLHRLIRLDIVGGDLETIGEEVMAISNLSMIDLSFYNNRISHVYERAFASFKELRFLSLKSNLVKEMKRSMLPDPAAKLELLDLGNNAIESLPPDMFTNMPNLETLSVAGNKLLTLRKETFSPVWEQLDLFQAMSNPLRCDCRLSWILKLKSPRSLRAVCDQPSNLRLRNLGTLTQTDLWCFL